MKTKIINLKNRKDRRRSIIYELKKIGIDDYSFVDAVNGKEKYKSINISQLMKGHYGCLDSHIKLLNSIHERIGYTLVLEDDCIFADEIKKDDIYNLLNKNIDFDLLYLGGNVYTFENSIIEMPDLPFNKANNVLCTHSYIINNSCIDRLLNVLLSEKNKVDVLFTKFQKDNNCYIVKKSMTWQATSQSDITSVVLKGDTLKF
jgi:GR25 family glycosyltransferase involved in LPS biosynthesis